MALEPCRVLSHLASTAHGPPGSCASVTLAGRQRPGLPRVPHQGPPESRTPVTPLQEALSPRGLVHCSGGGPSHSRDSAQPLCPEPTARQMAGRCELRRSGAAWQERPGHVEVPTGPVMGTHSKRRLRSGAET